jgi:hypothetical protein
VQRHQHHLVLDLTVGQLVGVGHERHLLEELVHHRELTGRADELAEVLDAAVGLDGVLGLELGEVPGAVDRRLQHVAGALVGVGDDRPPSGRAGRRTRRSRAPPAR